MMILSGLLAVIILILVGVILHLLSKEEEAPTVVTEQVETVKRPDFKQGSDTDLSAPKEDPKDEEPLVPPTQYIVTMNSTWKFADGTATSDNAYVANVKDNATEVYFDVTRNDTGEKIYHSPTIGRGEYLSKIRLDTDLDAGDYECTLTYYLLDRDQNAISHVDVWLKIQIEE